MMSNFTTYFSNLEMEEIEVFKEGTEGMCIEGEEVICFRVLSQIVNEHLQISEVSKADLLTSYAQLKGFVEVFLSFEFVDISVLKEILQKAKKLFLEELRKRKL